LGVSYDPEFTGTSLVVCAHLSEGPTPRTQKSPPPSDAQRLAFAIWQHISVTRPLLANWQAKSLRSAPSTLYKSCTNTFYGSSSATYWLFDIRRARRQGLRGGCRVDVSAFITHFC